MSFFSSPCHMNEKIFFSKVRHAWPIIFPSLPLFFSLINDAINIYVWAFFLLPHNLIFLSAWVLPGKSSSCDYLSTLAWQRNDCNITNSALRVRGHIGRRGSQHQLLPSFVAFFSQMNITQANRVLFQIGFIQAYHTFTPQCPPKYCTPSLTMDISILSSHTNVFKLCHCTHPHGSPKHLSFFYFWPSNLAPLLQHHRQKFIK